MMVLYKAIWRYLSAKSNLYFPVNIKSEEIYVKNLSKTIENSKSDDVYVKNNHQSEEVYKFIKAS